MSKQTRAEFVFVQIALIVLLSHSGERTASAQQTQAPNVTSETPTEPPARKQRPMTEYQLVGGLWRTDHTFQASIRVTNNLSIAPLSVTPVLYMADGTEYDLAAVQVPQLSVVTVSINQSLSAALPSLAGHLSTYGSASLKFNWRWSNAVTGSLLSLDVPRSLTFTSMMMGAPKPGDASQNQAAEGLWWTPFPGSDGFVALTNTGNTSQTATIQTFSASGDALDTLTQPVAVNATIYFALRDLVKGGTRAGVGGIRVSYQGLARALMVNGGIEDATRGYSAAINFTMSMPKMMATENSSLASAGMMIGHQDPMMGFPKNTVFRPYAFVRNISSRVVTVKSSLSYQMGSEDPQIIALPDTVLQPNQAASLFPSTGLSRKNTPRWDGSFNLLIATDAPPVSLVTATGSVDQTGNYVFEVEPQAVAPTEAKVIPYWGTADGNDTMISLWNPTSQVQDMILTLAHSGGKQYKYPVHLKAGASAMVSIKELQAMGTSDAEGNTLPKDVTSGSALLSSSAGVNEELNVIVSVGTFNVLTATCGSTCPTCLAIVNFWVNPSPFPVDLGYDSNMVSYEQNSSGGVALITAKSTWSSDNTPVAQVVSAGTYYGASVGSFNANAQANLINNDNQDCVRGDPCETSTFSDGAPGSVVSLACSPSTVMRGSSVTCGLNGPGTASTWVFTSSGGHGTVSASAGTTSTTWSGTAVDFGTVTAVASGIQVSASITVVGRGWLMPTYTATAVSNGDPTVVPTLPVPPSNSGSDSGLGYFHVLLADSGINTSVINSGPNQGYTYLSNQPDYSSGYFHYVVNPDLVNQNSTFSNHQYGSCGWIYWSNLNTQTFRHESGTPGHYSEYSQSLATNNPGAYLEPIIAGPADNAQTTFQTARSQTTADYNSIGTAAAAENIPPVNYDQNNNSLGNINYSPYASCP